jgi:SsrA-binding protein
MAKKSQKKSPNTIILNKKARHDYFIEDTYEGGLVLEGWEVKSIRAGKVQIKESYIKIKSGEVFLFGAHISALESASTHVVPDPMRTRKVLLHNYEILKLIALVERKGYTLVPLSLYWSKGRVKISIGVAKGKKMHDKRTTIKQRDWEREQGRILKNTR